MRERVLRRRKRIERVCCAYIEKVLCDEHIGVMAPRKVCHVDDEKLVKITTVKLTLVNIEIIGIAMLCVHSVAVDNEEKG